MGILTQLLHANGPDRGPVDGVVRQPGNGIAGAEEKSVWMNQIHGKNIFEIAFEFMTTMVQGRRKGTEYLKVVHGGQHVQAVGDFIARLSESATERHKVPGLFLLFV